MQFFHRKPEVQQLASDKLREVLLERKQNVFDENGPTNSSRKTWIFHPMPRRNTQTLPCIPYSQSTSWILEENQMPRHVKRNIRCFIEYGLVY